MLHIISLLKQARMTLVIAALSGWTMLVAGYACTKTVHPANQYDSTYYGRLSFVIGNNATFSYYDSALTHTGLLDTLSQAGPFTLVVPNDDAFAGYIAFGAVGNLNSLLWGIGPQALSPYTDYDIIRGQYDFRSLPLENNMELPSIAGSKVYLTRYLSGGDTVTTINGLPLISLDNAASNGTLDVLSASVPAPQIFPTVWQQLQADSNYAYFVAAAQRAHLDTLLSGSGVYTVLAPTNQAFESLGNLGLNVGVNTSTLDSILTADPVQLRQLIGYHILPGRYFLNDFIRLQPSGDSLLLNTVNGGTLSFFGLTGTPAPFLAGTVTPTFYGNGNQGQAAGIYNQIAGCAGNSCYFTRNQDIPAGNGVIQMLSSVLIP